MTGVGRYFQYNVMNVTIYSIIPVFHYSIFPISSPPLFDEVI